jgi:hypothetical protein
VSVGNGQVPPWVPWSGAHGAGVTSADTPSMSTRFHDTFLALVISAVTLAMQIPFIQDLVAPLKWI